MKKFIWIIIIFLSAAALTAVLVFVGKSQAAKLETQTFNGQRAYQDVLTQVDFGPRIPGSDAHEQTAQYIQAQLTSAGWSVELQELIYQNHPIKNIIAKRGSGSPLIIIGAHYDTRLIADRDPDPEKQNQPVPGANDGASGVAVLLEMSRILPKDIHGQIWLTFFDAEDQGNLPGWDWILGSRAFVEQLGVSPAAVVIVDMIGDRSLSVYQEKNSDQALSDEIWNVAKKLGYDKYIIPEAKYAILDDHAPFLEKGIPAVDMIDFVYPYWHTSQDTADKVSPDSLKIIGDTLREWIISKVSVGKN